MQALSEKKYSHDLTFFYKEGKTGLWHHEVVASGIRNFLWTAMVEVAVTLFIRIPELLNSNPRWGTRYTDWGFSQISSVTLEKFRDCTSIRHDRFLPDHFNSLLFTALPYNLATTQSLTHEAQPFLRSRQLCTYAGTFQHFMEHEGSLPCSLSWARSIQTNPYHPILSL
jgi:hypothetical protein